MTATNAVTARPAGVAYVNGAAGGANTGIDWPKLQDALCLYDTCGAFDEIWVARGRYTPGVTVSDTFTIPAGVALYGGFAATETVRTQRDWAANVTVLSGDLGGDDTADADGVVTNTTTLTGVNAYQVVLMVASPPPRRSRTRRGWMASRSRRAMPPGRATTATAAASSATPTPRAASAARPSPTSSSAATGHPSAAAWPPLLRAGKAARY